MGAVLLLALSSRLDGQQVNSKRDGGGLRNFVNRERLLSNTKGPLEDCQELKSGTRHMTLHVSPARYSCWDRYGGGEELDLAQSMVYQESSIEGWKSVVTSKYTREPLY